MPGEAGGGVPMPGEAGGGGGTDWSRYAVPDMWSMLSAHDSAAHHDLITGWRRSYELILEHLHHVRGYRDALAEAWPSHRSTAASAYLDRLDGLIGELWATHAAATENHRALSAATGALESSRRVLERIYREYAANQQLLAGYARALREYQLSPGKARGLPPREPTGVTARQTALDGEARELMSGLSTELAQARAALVTPKPHTSSSTTESDATVTRGAVAARASGDPGDGGSPGGSGDDGTGNGNRGMSEKSGAGDGDGGDGGGIGAGLGKAAASFPEVTDISPSIIGAGVAAGAAAGVAVGVAVPRRAPASTAVIGTPPRTATTVTGPERINPVGGVIGQPATGRPRRDGDHPRRRPDDPWATGTGIDPVLRPPDETPLAPGPAIGLPAA
ncbi:hypothetical protein [Actinoplanes sp. NPDC051851]|uniref:hypothetical protein n=1 Tax=Actinoplanes sp. NPDC051851 TaxID=3154753 RepID=UPI003428C5DD